MADSDQEVVQEVVQPVAKAASADPAAAPVAEDSDSVKALLSVVDAIGDSMSAADRAKYDALIERARAQG